MSAAAAQRTLEERLQRLEDHFEIYQILSAFAPVIDGGADSAVAEFFTERGEYVTDVSGFEPAVGRDAVRQIFSSPVHRSHIEKGISHTLSFPHIVVRGDEAEAICYATICVREEGGWHVSRVAANSFRFVREKGGWRMSQRVSRQLGPEHARKVFSAAALNLPWAR